MRIAYVAAHYGKDLLPWALRSVQDAVDETHILYTATPSFGHGTHLVCPDTRQEMAQASLRFATKPVHWHEGRWPNEGAHRTTILDIARQRGARQILWVDADEVWAPGAAQAALDAAREQPAGVVRVRFIHFWRSFGWACEDPSMPTRIINVERDPAKLWYLSPQAVPVLHFGYAQPLELIRYKQDIHGHKAEWRPEWFAEKFQAWTPGSGITDVHPTCRDNFWEPRPVPPHVEAALDATMHDHPHYGLELIA